MLQNCSSHGRCILLFGFLEVAMHMYTYGDLLLIQVCNDNRPLHCSTGQGKKASLLFSAVLLNRLTAALCPCKHTYGGLLFIQV